MKTYLLFPFAILIPACSGLVQKNDQEEFGQDNGITVHPYRSEIMSGYPPSKENLVTLENWDLAPYNRWAYQHFRELVPTQNISRGFDAVNNFQRQPMNLDTLLFKDAGGEEITIKQMLEKTFTDAFVVLKDGRIVTEQYFAGMQPSSQHLLQSASKFLTISLLAILIDQGKIAQHGKVHQYVPELANSGYSEAEVTHLANMLSGVSYASSFSDPESHLYRHMRSYLWKPRDSPDKGHRDFLMTLEKEADHGTRFSYKDSDTEVLAWIIEKRMNRSFSDLFSDLLWSKVGAEYDAFITCDGLGSPVASGGYNVTLRDFARIGQLYLGGGKWGDRQIIPASHVNDLVKAAETIRFTTSPAANYSSKESGFRNGFWIPEGHEGAYTAYGYQGQYLYIHPKSNIVIAKFSTYPEGNDSYLRDTDWNGFYAISKSLGSLNR